MAYSLRLLVVASFCACGFRADASPEGGIVSAGQASISAIGQNLDIHQTSNRAVIDWNSFNIAPAEKVEFYQPSAQAIALNRIGDNSASQIEGALKANGTVILINPNGVVFSKGSKVDVNGLIASTAGISNEKFMAGSLKFDQPGNPSASIINEGQITAREAGLVGLVAPNVINHGVIEAKLGRVQLSSGDTMTVDLYGDHLLEVAVSDELASQLVRTDGIIRADGGSIAITAAAGKKILDSLVDVQGDVQSLTVDQKTGTVIISAEKTGASKATVAGNITVSGTKSGEKGGTVKVLADKVVVASGSKINASGDAGGGTIHIGGEYQGHGTTPTARTTLVGKASLKADALTSGDGGQIILWADQDTVFYGDISAKGGALAGDGGFVEVSGKEFLNFKGAVDTTAVNGKTGLLLLDPANIVIADGTADSAADGTGTFAGTPSGTAGTITSTQTGPTTIYESELQGIAATTNIALAATNSITINDLTDNALTLAQTSGRSVSFTTGVGGFTMLDVNDTISTNGGAFNLTTTGGSSTIGKLATGSGLVTLNIGGTATVNTISGTGGLVKSGSGTVLMNGLSTYTGTTTVNFGTLQLGIDNALASTTAVTVNANAAGRTAVFDLNGFNQTIASLTLGGTGGTTTSTNNVTTGAGTLTLGGNVTFTNTGNPLLSSITGKLDLGSAARTFTINDSTTANPDVTIAATISGTGGITKAGAGTLALTGANSYSGTTTLTAGTLQVGNDTALGTGTLTLNGGTIRGDGVARTLANAISHAAASFIGGTSDLIFTGLFTNNGALTLTNNNSGTTTLGAVNLSNSGTNRILTFAGTGNTTITGLIANGSTSTTSGITKIGTGTLTLAGTSTYGGATTINQGTLQLGASNALASNAAVTVNGNAAGRTALFDLNGFDQTIGSLTLGGTGGTTTSTNNVATGAGTLTLGGNVTFTNTGNPLESSITGNLNLGSAARSFTVGDSSSAASDLTIAANISGTGGLVKAGLGTLTLSGSNSYSGGTTVNNGALELGASNVLLNTGAVTVNGNGTNLTALFDLNGFDQTIGLLTFGGTGGTTTSTSNVATGAGALTLSNGITYANSGNPKSATISGNLNLPSTQTVTVNDSTTTTQDLIINAIISGIGGLTKAGTGTLVLSGDNSYTGTTTLSAGTLRATTYANALGLGALSLGGGTLQLANDTALDFARDTTVTAATTITSDRLTAGAGVTHQLGNLTQGTFTLTAGAGTNVTSGTAGIDFGTATFSGNPTFTVNTLTNLGLGALGNGGVARTITKVGIGVLGLNDAPASWALANALVINQGTVQLGASGALGTTTNVTVNANAAGRTALLNLNDFDQTIASLTLGGAGGTTTSTNNVSTGNGTLTLAGGVTLTNTGNPLASTISGKLNLGSAARTFTINDSSTANPDVTVSAVISGTGGLVKAGTGTLALTAANTYSGTTTLTAGSLQVGSNTALGISGLTLNGGTIRGDGTARTLANAVSHAAASFIAGASDLIFTGLFINNAALTLTNNNSATTTFGAVNLSNSSTSRILTIGGTGTTRISGAVANGSTSTASGLTKTGTGTLVLAGTASYGGATTVNGGTLQLGANNVLPSTNNVTVNATTAGQTALFDLNGFNQSVGSLTLGGTGGTATSTSNVATGAGTLTLGGNVSFVNTGSPLGSTISGKLNFGGATRTITVADSSNASSDLTISALISGTGGLTKAGAGALALSGTNSYSGATTINAGTLKLVGGGAILDTVGVTLANAAGAVLDLVDDETIAFLSGGGAAGGNVTLNSQTLTTGNATNTTFGGVMSGTGGHLVKTGTGSFTLTGANSYTGATDINQGSLILGAAERIGDSSAVTVASGATFDLGGFNETVGSITSNGNVIFAAGTNFTTTGFQLYNTAISGSGLHLSAGTDITATHSLNDFTGDLRLTAGGAVDIVDANSLSLGASTVGNIFARALAGDVNLHGVLSATDTTGTAITLLASGNFTNTAGASALQVGGGANWRVYSTSPLTGNRGGIAYDFKQYNAAYGDTVLGAGNGFLYTLAPVVTPSLTGTVSKTYNGTLAAALTGANYTLSGDIDGDTVVLDSFSTTGSYDTAHAGTGKTVSVSGIGAEASNGGATVYGYQLSTSSLSGAVGEITPAPITIGTPDVSKTYNGSLTAAGTAVLTSGTLYANASNGSLTDSISGGSFAFADANVGTGKTVHVSGVTMNDGNGGGNYDVTYADNTASIVTPAPITISTSNISKTYNGGLNAAGTAVVTSGSLYSNASNGGTADSLSGGTFAFTDANAGTGKTVEVSAVTVNDGNSGGNYDVTYADNTASVITPAPITISTSNVSKTYNGTVAAAGTAVVTSGTLYSNVSNGSVTDSISGGSFAYSNANAGTNKTVTTSGVTVSDGNGGGNYNVTYANNTASTITPAPLTVTTTDVTKTYNGASNAAGTAVVTSGTLYANASNGGVVDTVSGGAFAFTDVNAGTGKTVTVGNVAVNDGNAGGNYQVTYAANTNSTINLAPITVRAVNQSKANDKTLLFAGTEFIRTGSFYGSDGISHVTLTSAGAPSTATTQNNPYAIVASNAVGSGLSNYAITYVNGRLTVKSARTVPSSLSALEKTYSRFAEAVNAPSLFDLSSDVPLYTYDISYFWPPPASGGQNYDALYKSQAKKRRAAAQAAI